LRKPTGKHLHDYQDKRRFFSVAGATPPPIFSKQFEHTNV